MCTVGKLKITFLLSLIERKGLIWNDSSLRDVVIYAIYYNVS